MSLTTVSLRARGEFLLLRGFERVRLLAAKFAPEELPLLTGMAAGVVDQYLALLAQHGLRGQEAGQLAGSM